MHNGKWELLPGGPHLQKLSKDDIVFNAEQTADLIRTGKTARSGKVVSAHADGTTQGLDIEALAKGTYGNVDLNNRQRIKWTAKNLKKYRKELKSWGLKPKKNSYSTVLGGSGEFNGV